MRLDTTVTAPEKPPGRVWRTYGTDPLPSRAEALALPLTAFPGWFLKVTCARCGKEWMINEAYAPWHIGSPLAAILAQMQHDGCGGLPARAELLTGIEGVSSRPARKIVLRGGNA